MAAKFIISTRFIAMDPIKHRKTWLVYIADMKSWKLKKAGSWKSRNMKLFHGKKLQCTENQYSRNNNWGWSCKQTSYNREDKTCGGLKRITRNQNSHNRHYLAAPVLAQLQEEMVNKELVFFLFLRVNTTILVRLMSNDKGCWY